MCPGHGQDAIDSAAGDGAMPNRASRRYALWPGFRQCGLPRRRPVLQSVRLVIRASYNNRSPCRPLTRHRCGSDADHCNVHSVCPAKAL